MKQVAKVEASLESDPKPMDRVTWQRIRVAVAHEAVHRDWGCALYTLHRTGRINNDQREAGDKYARLVRDFRKLWVDSMGSIYVYPVANHDERTTTDGLTVQQALGLAVADGQRGDSEFETKRAARISKRYKEAAAIAGPARGVLEELLIDEVWPAGERGHIEIRHALERLNHFFNTGTKRKHPKRAII
jgi:hypothetical protein